MIIQEEIKYSYQDCWNYAVTLTKNVAIEQVKNDLIVLCQTTSERFWLNFSDKCLSVADYSLICHNINKYLKENYPLPYLTKQVSFYGLSFLVEEGIFIPQKATEILVEKTLEIANKHWNQEKSLKVLDIGTGCGNIVISLGKSKPNWHFTAVDINKKALKLAKINARKNQIKSIKFIHSDLFNNLATRKKFNIIVANPPYVSKEEYENMTFVAKRQPLEALLAEENGYFFYQKIFAIVSSFLTKKFLLLVEIGYQQEQKIIKLLTNCFPQKSKVSIFLDYEGHSRVAVVYQ